MNYPTNSDDIIDSREVIEAIDELTESGDDAQLLAQLVALAAEASDYSEDWLYGATLIRYSYFKDYAIDLADDIGAIGKGLDWPLNCIDWERAARELRMDYTAVEFDNVTYWVR